MAKKKKEKEAGAPLWMVTMSDMNTLLMTFFVILFSMMVQDERLFMDLKRIFKEMSRFANPEKEGPIPRSPFLNDLPSGDDPGVEEALASREEIPRPKHLDVRITKRPGEYVIHLDQEMGFGEGVYRLTPEHREVLDFVKDVMKGYQHHLIVRGFTDRTPTDAFVLQKDELRPATAADRYPDHFLLASLRAQEVRKYLTSGTDAVNDRQVRVGEYGKQSKRRGPYERENNRRVEIVIGSGVAAASQ